MNLARELPDVQQTTEGFPKKAIKKVGVRNIKIPLPMYVPSQGKLVPFEANISSYCDLVPELKGINMSRIGRTLFKEVETASGPFQNLEAFARGLKRAHSTDNIFVKARLSYMMRDTTPISQLDSYESVAVVLETELRGDTSRHFLSVETVEYSVCPCSKEMSLLKNNLTASERQELDDAVLSPQLLRKISMAGFGAHSQKSYISVKVELCPERHREVYIEELVALMKSASSCPTQNILKRPDEKYVTEVGYMGAIIDEDRKLLEIEDGGPKFVEDISRQAAEGLDTLVEKNLIRAYDVVVRNDESIHSGDLEAVAVIEYR